MGMDKLDIWKGKKGKKNCIIKNYLQDTEIYIYGIFSFAFFGAFCAETFFSLGVREVFFLLEFLCGGAKWEKMVDLWGFPLIWNQ